MSEKRKGKSTRTYKWVNKWKKEITLAIIFAGFIFLHLYQLEARMSFDWDQVDNAWAAQQILVAHSYPLKGMMAKASSGFNIGPGYYYLIAPVYAIFNMSPIASGVIAFLTSIVTFCVVYLITKKLFSEYIALIAVFIITVSDFILTTDRTQWPVNFIVPVSFLVFYSLYKVVTGDTRHILWLAILLGFSLHIHFTSVFYFLAVLLALPLFPRKKKTLYHVLLSAPFFLMWLAPTIYVLITEGGTQGTNMSNYIATYYHGLHATRVFQLIHDAMIEFNLILRFPYTDYLGLLLPPIFAVIYYYKKREQDRIKLIYLMALWFIIPWLVFATYRGEIVNYYFYMTRPMVLIVLSYLTYRILTLQNIIPKMFIVAFWGYFAVTNVADFVKVEKDFEVNCTEYQDKFAKRENTRSSYLNYYCTHHYKK